MEKAYSDRRWWDAPVGIDSDCCNCQGWHGFGKCDKYPEGIPREMLDKSFPGTEKYKKNYCKDRKTS